MSGHRHCWHPRSHHHKEGVSYWMECCGRRGELACEVTRKMTWGERRERQKADRELETKL